MKCDIFMVGVGGQGILTIGEILATAAMNKSIPVSFYPSKGMAQRGGFVKAQLRIGSENAGPAIRECGADVVFAMELSESLKAVRYIKRGGDFIVLRNVWAPTAVLLGKADYPSVDTVKAEVEKARARLILIDEDDVPEFNGQKVADNVFMLGSAIRNSVLADSFSFEEIETVILDRWKKATEANSYAFKSGFDYKALVMENK